MSASNKNGRQLTNLVQQYFRTRHKRTNRMREELVEKTNRRTTTLK